MTTDIANYGNPLAAFKAAAEELGTGNKQILKFQKGDWVLGQEGEELKPGTRLALNMAAAEWGWVRWRDGVPVERRMVAVASGIRPPQRFELGHDDEGLWLRDEDGRQRDPWQRMTELAAREVAGERREVILSGGSKGWESCCRQLFGDYVDGARDNPGKAPIVELGSDSYQHRAYGRVKVPSLPIVAWATEEELEAGEAKKRKPSAKRI